MGECEALEVAREEGHLHEAVVGDAPVGQHLAEAREGVEGDLRRATARVGGEEGRNHHVAAGGVHSAVLRVEGLAGIHCAGQEARLGIVAAVVARLQALGHDGYVGQELVEGVAVVAVAAADAAQGGGDGYVGLGVAARVDGVHVVVHELHLVGAVVGAVAREGDFKAAYGLELDLGVKLAGLGIERWRGHALVVEQPAAVFGLLDVAVVGEAEGEVEARGHDVVVRVLAEDVAHVGNELRQRQRAGVAPAHAHAAHHHGEAGGILRGLGPEVLVVFEHLHHVELHVFVATGENLHRVVVLDFEAYGEAFAVGGGGGDVDALHIHVVLYYEGSVGAELVGAVELLDAPQLRVAASAAGEALVHVAQVGDFVVELLQIHAAVHVERSLVGNGVARRHAVDHGAAVPIVGGVVGGVGRDEVEERNAAEGGLVGGGERLVVAPRRAQVLYALPHGVAPLAVAVGEELFVHLAHGLLDVGGGVAVKGHAQRLGEVPRDGKLAVPEEVFAHRHGQLHIHVAAAAGLLLVVVARYVAVEGDVGRQPVQLPLAEELHVLVFAADHALEGGEGLHVGRPAILEAAAVVVGVLIHVVGVG